MDAIFLENACKNAIAQFEARVITRHGLSEYVEALREDVTDMCVDLTYTEDEEACARVRALFEKMERYASGAEQPHSIWPVQHSTPDAGLSTGTLIALGVGAAVAVVGVLYYALKE